MAINYMLGRDDEIFVQAEAAYGVSPGALAGSDAFKHTSRHDSFMPELAEKPRDQERDSGQRSVVTNQTGRSRSTFSIETNVVPSGVTGTPTAPDVHDLLKAAIGAESTLTAHTTTTSGSVGTSLVLTAGGGAASGIPVGGGCLIAVDVSAAFGVEVRRVVSRSTDTLTLNAAFSADPATGRNVYVGTTYKLLSSQLLSVYFWLFNLNLARYVVPGAIVNDFSIDVSYADEAPLAKLKFAGVGQWEAAQASTSRPTPTTAGVPLTSGLGKFFYGATLGRLIGAHLNIKNGLELREIEGHSMQPTGVKGTGNNSRHVVEMAVDCLLSTGDIDSKAQYDAAATISQIDAIIQIGTGVGNIVAWNCPKWEPGKRERPDQGGEVGLKLSGRAFAATTDDEVYVSFI